MSHPSRHPLLFYNRHPAFNSRLQCSCRLRYRSHRQLHKHRLNNIIVYPRSRQSVRPITVRLSQSAVADRGIVRKGQFHRDGRRQSRFSALNRIQLNRLTRRCRHSPGLNTSIRNSNRLMNSSNRYTNNNNSNGCHHRRRSRRKWHRHQ
jgi:hypothetical protein